MGCFENPTLSNRPFSCPRIAIWFGSAPKPASYDSRDQSCSHIHTARTYRSSASLTSSSLHNAQSFQGIGRRLLTRRKPVAHIVSELRRSRLPSPYSRSGTPPDTDSIHKGQLIRKGTPVDCQIAICDQSDIEGLESQLGTCEALIESMGKRRWTGDRREKFKSYTTRWEELQKASLTFSTKYKSRAEDATTSYDGSGSSSLAAKSKSGCTILTKRLSRLEDDMAVTDMAQDLDDASIF